MTTPESEPASDDGLEPVPAPNGEAPPAVSEPEVVAEPAEPLDGGPEIPEVVAEAPDGEADADGSAIREPARVMRIGAMIRQLRDEVNAAPLDEASRERLREIYETSVQELATALSPDLVEELQRMTSPFESDAPSEAELRIAQAQLVGWLEGLFQGMQAMLMAQQMAAQAQLQEMRQGQLGPGGRPGPPPTPGEGPERPGVYL
ncbi:MAG: proteasome activator [Actinomycetota bacterium]